MAILVPIVIAVLGLGAGVGAGLALKPPPEEPEHAAEAEACPEGADEPCEAPAHDPFAPVEEEHTEVHGEAVYVPLEKPFVVPIFKDEKVTAMVVVSLSVATDEHGAHAVEAMQPRLRDSYLKVMFRHANSGGFDGLFTAGQKMHDLKSALLASTRKDMPDFPISEILVTEIARQDV